MPFRARCNPACLIRRQNATIAIRRGPPVARNSLLEGHNPIADVALSGQSYRHNSTSSLFSPFTSFFSRAKGLTPTSPDQAASEFINSISTSQYDTLHSSYIIIINSPSPSTHLSQEILHDAMALLSESRSMSELELLRRIYDDLPTRFGYPISSEQENLLIKGLCLNGLIEDALSLAQSIDPQHVDWRLLLQSASSDYPSLVDSIIPFLRQYSKLDQTDVALILRSIRNTHSRSTGSLTRSKLDTVLEEIREKGITLDLPTEAELMRIHISLGELEKASEIVDRWDTKYITSPALWNAMVELAIARNDRDIVEELIGRMKDRGIKAPQKALTFLSVQNLRSYVSSRSTMGFSEIVGSVDHAEKICGVESKADVWAEVVRVYLVEVKSHDNLDVVLEVYSEILSRGIEVSAELARNIIIPLSNSRQQSRLNDMMRIYDDYLSSSLAFKTRRETHKFQPVYQYLLMSCAKSEPPATTFALRLLNDMKVHQVEISSGNMISLLVLLMKSSEDHYSAFNLYSHFYDLSHSSIDEEGYKVILINFLNLYWDRSPFCPPELFIAIMKDMSKNGYQPDSHILSSLLKQYGSQATKLRRKLRSTPTVSGSTAISPYDEEVDIGEQLDTLSQSIRDIHTLLKLDPLIIPDIPLLSAMMDAYSRVGAYSECFEVWDELVSRRSREAPEKLKELYAAGLNVILDACGWSYSLNRGRKIWAWAKKWELVWEKKHFDSYVEFLCRNSQLAEAGGFVLDEMGGDGPEADKESVRIVLKFGRRERDYKRDVGVMGDFVRRLRDEKGELYEQLREEGELEGY
ncbi:hypothetical protein I302_106497 [Kwoniella bestiolae CBS 10118]|uniref:Pentatricopeptide repeat domain-containing protein n=1 Tax=Kwoniella bestiolae CBS 10118 TaxID=1296100 RepID=A0A1B9G177_9TREE|nr:hypothetical protein I302_06245 [Kwoniella bestiolae CBS 10118]OCF24784.1 hypothetical protein I302_06245 [Kwoniella bestiolae CBS 10118]